MLIFLKLVLIFSVAHAKCEFKKDTKSVVSLSGPITVVLKELGLLKHKKLKGISIFNPVSQNDFEGKIYPGGVFLSQSSLQELKENVVFFDESREMDRNFKSLGNITAREIKTRNLLPLEVLDLSLHSLQDLLSGCEKKISEMKDKAVSFQKEILKKFPHSYSVIFYLGELRGKRFPEMIMANDGVVKLLRQKSKLTTYPSELAYVNWSSKMMKELPDSTLHIGLKDSGMDMVKKIKRSSKRMTFIYPGVLVPGYSQLEAFHHLVQNL
ncbi:MAG: hypothetical protein ACLGHN_09500 [Bacteriovoracia bacterium]